MSTKTLSVLVVGGGLGGFAAAIALRQAGHHITVVDQADAFGEVGAGLQLVPNATRMLRSLGVLSATALKAVAPEATMRRRWQDGRVLGELRLGAEVEARYGAPYWNAHRADLHAALLAASISPSSSGTPVTVKAGVHVQTLEWTSNLQAAAVDQHGTRWPADLIVGADGIHSTVRQGLFGADTATPGGDDAYRVLIPAAELRGKASDLLDETKVMIWLGPDRHAIHYWIRERSLLNVVAIVPAAGDARESWSGVGEREVLMAAFAGWDSRLREILASARALGRWRLRDRSPLERWSLGNVCLLGDACHPMLPYQSQGAAQTLEDAVCLGEALRDWKPDDSLTERLQLYEGRRKDRASRIQAASFGNRAIFHLADGAEQHARDVELARQQGDFKSYDWAWANPTQ